MTVHEVGHGIGIDHAFDCNQIMGVVSPSQGCLSPNQLRRTLGAGDQRGVRVLYPADETLVKGSSPTLYAIQNATGNVPWKRQIPNPITLEANFGTSGWNNILTTTDTLINAFPVGHALIDAASDGYLLKGSSSTVYVMKSLKKRPIAGGGVIDQCYGWDAIHTVSNSSLSSYSTGSTLYGPPCPYLIPPQGYILRGAGGANTYVTSGGHKRDIVSSGVFDQCGYSWANLNVLADSYWLTFPMDPT